MIMLIFFVFLAGLIFVILHKALDRMYFGPIVLAVLTFVISTMIYSWISEGYIETKEVLKESQKIENQKGWIALKEDHGSKVYTNVKNVKG